jgi:hypothetical protein
MPSEPNLAPFIMFKAQREQLAIAAGPNVFRPDSNALVELLIHIQSMLSSLLL